MSQRESGKGRGRPTGTFGSSLLRRSLQREFDEENDADSVSAVSARPGRPRKQDSLENSDLTDGHSGQVRALLLQPDRTFQPTILQELVIAHGKSQAKLPVDGSGLTNPAEMILSHGRRHIISQAGVDYSNADVRRVAATLIESSTYFWGCLFTRIGSMLDSDDWEGLMFVVTRRYDETPLFLRITEADSQPQPMPLGGTQSESPDSQHLQKDQLVEVADGSFSLAQSTCPKMTPSPKPSPSASTGKRSAKIMQSELQVHVLLRHKTSGRTVQLGGKLPTQLQCLETTKAPQIVKNQLEMMAVIPNLEAVSSCFQQKLLLTTTDRFGANLAAERDIQARFKDFVSTHMPCGVHELSTCEKAMSDITSGHVGGLLSLGLSMRSAGALKELRKCLAMVLEERLVVKVGNPKCVEHRNAMYDLFLPVHDNICTEVGNVSRRNSSCQNAQRRCILNHFLNGDIFDQENVVHYTPVLRSRNEILEDMRRHLINCLLPRCCPVLNRSKWLGCETCFSYVGVLLTHHGLLAPLLMKWKNQQSTLHSEGSNLAAGPAPGPGLGPLWDGWAAVAAGMCGGISSERLQQDQSEDMLDEQVEDGPDDEFLAETPFDPVTGDLDP